jgi:hypothetical protein
VEIRWQVDMVLAEIGEEVLCEHVVGSVECAIDGMVRCALGDARSSELYAL